MTRPSSDAVSAVDELAKLQMAASELMGRKELLVSLDITRQRLGEAVRILDKPNADFKTWMCFGETTFLLFPTETAVSILKSDLKTVEESIEETRKELKVAKDSLLSHERTKGLSERGFDLKPILE